jgi:hypothetical protein
MDAHKPTKVYDRKGILCGVIEGERVTCEKRSCPGEDRIVFKIVWPDGHILPVCTKNLIVRPDGEYQVK